MGKICILLLLFSAGALCQRGLPVPAGAGRVRGRRWNKLKRGSLASWAAPPADWRDTPVVVVTGRDLTEDDRSRLNGAVERILQKTERDTMLHELHGELSKCIARRHIEAERRPE